jgi:hypothetical protein
VGVVKPLVIYHGGCRDGFCALWVLHRRFGEDGIEFHAGYYGQPPPDITGRLVYMVDFSYPRPVLAEMADKCAALLILDHHKTAEEALRGFAPGPRANVEVHFDMNRSGAGMAWDHFFPGQERHWLVSYVEDRDLWRHALPDAKAVGAYISTLPFTFEAWDAALTTGQQDFVEVMGDELVWARRMGEGALRKTQQYVREAAGNARCVRFEGLTVPVVNAPQVDISELLDALCYDERSVEGVALGWWQRGDGVFQYSLRSRGSVDVSELAKRYGGGGHKGAAGFQRETMLDLEVLR